MPAQGTLAKSLEQAKLSAAGKIQITGAFTAGLAPVVTHTRAGTVPPVIAGSLSKGLASLTLSAAGTDMVAGSLSAWLQQQQQPQ